MPVVPKALVGTATTSSFREGVYWYLVSLLKACISRHDGFDAGNVSCLLELVQMKVCEGVLQVRGLE